MRISRSCISIQAYVVDSATVELDKERCDGKRTPGLTSAAHRRTYPFQSVIPMINNLENT
jgi:hypothetical protein